MKFVFVFLLLYSSAAIADSLGSPEPLAKSSDDQLKQTYEGNIRGIRALMSDLKYSQPSTYQKLKHDFDDLDARQSKADTIAYTTYGVSAALVVYGMAKWFGAFQDKSSPSDSGFSFTPFLLSLGTSFTGGWIYALTRPSPQEYLDFTNKHNRLNKRQQLEWKVGMDLQKKSASVGIAYRF